jgi:hypothetical protein
MTDEELLKFSRRIVAGVLNDCDPSDRKGIAEEVAVDLRTIARAAAEEAALLALGIGQTMHEGTKYAEGYEDGAKDAARAIVLGAVQPAVCDHREVDRADAILDTLRTRSQGQGGGNG